jgi:hypothetical protein
MNSVTIEKSRYSTNYEDFAFLHSAIDMNDRREVLHYVLVEDNLAITTDGHRLHTVSFYNSGLTIEPGLYAITKTAKQVILVPAADQSLNFPAWSQVFPTEGEMASHDIHGDYTLERILSNYAHDKAIEEKRTSLDLNYLKPLAVKGASWTMRVFGECAPVVFQNCTKTALIMPVVLK